MPLLILTGDVNLMNVTDAAVPFARVGDELRKADVIFGNLECCLYASPRHSLSNEGFIADPVVGGEALKRAGMHAGGIANNVHYIEAVTFQFVRHNERNETLFCPIDKEADALAELKASSAAYGTSLTVKGDQVQVDLKG